jgi:hypothetical protein
MKSNLNSRSLFEALDAEGFVYDIRHSANGMPYACFRWECPPLRLLRSFTALLESGSLQLTLHESIGPDGLLDEHDCLVRQSNFPVARLYSTDNYARKIELTAAILMNGVKPNIAPLKILLSHLASNADDLLGNPRGESRQAPSLGGATEEVSLKETLRNLGLYPRQEQGAFSVDMTLPGLQVGGRFLVYHLGVGWVRVSAHLHQDDSLALDRLRPGFVNQLQIWAPTGRFVSVEVRGRRHLGCEVATPYLGRSASQVIADSIRAATQMLGTAYKQVN